VHGTIGVLNFAIAYTLFSYYGFDKYVAMLCGHVIHVSIAFYFDRDVTFRAQEERGLRALQQYWIVDIVSLCAMFMTFHILTDWLMLHRAIAQNLQWSQDKAVAVIRAVPVMLVGSLVVYGLNKLWTFNEANQQS
jgi:putative flippase GtrA